MSRAVLVLFALSAAACAREAAPLRMAPASHFPPENVGYGWPPPTLGAAPPLPPRPLVAGVGVAAEAAPPPGRQRPLGPASKPSAIEPRHPSTLAPLPAVDPDVPGGALCLASLDAQGVAYERLESKLGVETPIAVSGPLGGIRYEGGNGKAMVLDCRLALALTRIAPVLRDLGVSAVRYSGAYSYRMSKVGRLSYHAHGLAIDVHELVVNGKRLAVQSDFARGLGDGCAEQSPPLNRVACRLKSTGMFRELLTPDYNADHHDHMHWGVAPIAPSKSSSQPK